MFWTYPMIYFFSYYDLGHLNTPSATCMAAQILEPILAHESKSLPTPVGEEEKVEPRRDENVEKRKQRYITQVRQRKGWALKEQVKISLWRIAGKVSWNGGRNDECGSAGKPLIWMAQVCFCRKRICLWLIWSRRRWLHLGPNRGFTLNIKALFPSAQPESDSVPFNFRTEKCGRTGEINVVFKY